MSNVLNSTLILCPYCGEQLEIVVDSSAGSQNYIEDCQVCCSPIEISIEIDTNSELLEIRAHTDSE